MRIFLALFLVLLSCNVFASEKCEFSFTTSSDLRATIRAEYLELVPLQPMHLDRLKELYKTDDVKRFFLGEHFAGRAAARHIKWSVDERFGNREVFSGRWAIVSRGRFAGVLELVRIDPEKVLSSRTNDALYLNVGYALASSFRGHGIASRALAMAVDFAEHILRADYLYASTNILNIPSQKLLERNGFLKIETDNKNRVRYLRRLTK